MIFFFKEDNSHNKKYILPSLNQDQKKLVKEIDYFFFNFNDEEKLNDPYVNCTYDCNNNEVVFNLILSSLFQLRPIYICSHFLLRSRLPLSRPRPHYFSCPGEWIFISFELKNLLKKNKKHIISHLDSFEGLEKSLDLLKI